MQIISSTTVAVRKISKTGARRIKHIKMLRKLKSTLKQPPCIWKYQSVKFLATYASIEKLLNYFLLTEFESEWKKSRFRNLQCRPKKTRLARYLLYYNGLRQRIRFHFEQTFESRGCTAKLSYIIAQASTERGIKILS